MSSDVLTFKENPHVEMVKHGSPLKSIKYFLANVQLMKYMYPVQFDASLFFVYILFFHRLKLEMALAIPVLNDEKSRANS